MVVSITEAKAKLSRLIDMVSHGETVVITKNNRPIADLVMHEPDRVRRLGILQGKIDIPGDFNEESVAINTMFYGENGEDNP